MLFLFIAHGYPSGSTLRSDCYRSPYFNNKWKHVSTLVYMVDLVDVVLLGFKNKQSCRLMNTSLVSMSFHLRIPGDGTTTSSICATDDLDFDTSSVCMATTPHHGLTGHSIKEFDVQPSTGMILPQCDIVIDVTMTSNQVRTYNDVLTVDIDGVSSDILCLPVTARLVSVNLKCVIKFMCVNCIICVLL